jgi:hypothetical protein
MYTFYTLEDATSLDMAIFLAKVANVFSSPVAWYIVQLDTEYCLTNDPYYVDTAIAVFDKRKVIKK